MCIPGIQVIMCEEETQGEKGLANKGVGVGRRVMEKKKKKEAQK